MYWFIHVVFMVLTAFVLAFHYSYLKYKGKLNDWKVKLGYQAWYGFLVLTGPWSTVLAIVFMVTSGIFGWVDSRLVNLWKLADKFKELSEDNR